MDWAQVDRRVMEQRVELDPPDVTFNLGRRGIDPYYDASLRIITAPKRENEAQYELYARQAANLYDAEYFDAPKVMYEKK
ncbi:hypothetical protein ACFTUC_39820 [Streptomyces sp. NPDC056944]|uniref:hypothetical protein n=1 Tax=Streptomyces sp. NPDC056944 TaxID=3345972 RepID=UPI003642191E